MRQTNSHQFEYQQIQSYAQQLNQPQSINTFQQSHYPLQNITPMQMINLPTKTISALDTNDYDNSPALPKDFLSKLPFQIPPSIQNKLSSFPIAFEMKFEQNYQGTITILV